MPKARIKLISKDAKSVIAIAKQIVDIAKQLNVKYIGPIPLPTKSMTIPTRKTPCGDGSHTYEHWTMRIHKILVEIDGSEQALRQIMRISVPDTVQIEMSIS